jgi:hypothetical protein
LAPLTWILTRLIVGSLVSVKTIESMPRSPLSDGRVS